MSCGWRPSAQRALDAHLLLLLGPSLHVCMHFCSWGVRVCWGWGGGAGFVGPGVDGPGAWSPLLWWVGDCPSHTSRRPSHLPGSVKVTFVNHTGQRTTLPGRVGQSLLDLSKQYEYNWLEGACVFAGTLVGALLVARGAVCAGEVGSSIR
jgi:hypothetical protein